MPQSGQASFSENVCSLPPTMATVTRPLASFSAVAMDCSRARGDARFDAQAVDDDFDGGVILALVNDRELVQREKFAIDSNADVAVLRKFFEFFSEGAFRPRTMGAEDHDAVVGFTDFAVQNGLNDLFAGLARDGLAAIRAVRNADGGVDHAEVVVYFGDGADGGTRRRRVVVFCSMAIEGESPSMTSTSGRSIWSRNWRA